MEFFKRCKSSYFYFAHLNKENQILLFPLISGEQEIFHKKGILANQLHCWNPNMMPFPNHRTYVVDDFHRSILSFLHL